MNVAPFTTKHEFAAYDWSAPANDRWHGVVSLRNAGFAAKYLSAVTLPDGTAAMVLCDATVDGTAGVASNGDIQYTGCPLILNCTDSVYLWNWVNSTYELYYLSAYARGTSNITAAGWFIDEFIVNRTDPDPSYQSDLGYGYLFNAIGSNDGFYLHLDSNVITYANLINYPVAYITQEQNGVVAVPFGLNGIDPSP